MNKQGFIDQLGLKLIITGHEILAPADPPPPHTFEPYQVKYIVETFRIS